MELKTVKFTETNSQGVKFNFTLHNFPIYTKKEIEEFCDYLKKVNPIEENPFQLQCDNNTWLATEETILRPRIPIDWCSISDDWDKFRKTL